ncbi:MAG: heavy metal-binding domain-containing protein [Caldilineaceae bacterium]|nr:heavy metal-binding domain-containing protein [Caldilineaceae bacterium]MCB0127261.1 heavy metal-binding domain-containing protein [Caldilineaceae bacterium]
MLISLDYYPTDPNIEIGELLVTVSVTAANVVNDIRENIRNLIGGRMQHYEKLIDKSVANALLDLDAKAKAKGYDGVIGVKIANPTVVDGGVEVIVYGNGFRRKEATQ